MIQGDGSRVPFDSADVVYVNAGATRPADSWLDQLKDDGRLILPLTIDNGFTTSDRSSILHRGAVFLITRQAEEFRARWISPVAIYPCEGMRDAESKRALAAAFDKRGAWIRVARLYRTDDLPEERCWLRAPDWCLAYD